MTLDLRRLLSLGVSQVSTLGTHESNTTSSEHVVKTLSVQGSPRHSIPHMPPERFSIRKILGRLLVERIARVGLEEQELQSDERRVEVQYGLPVLA